jgi:hypothetical protein
MDPIMKRPNTPENLSESDEPAVEMKLCAADGCRSEGLYPAPKSRDALRDYLWFCMEHVRAYNKSWNYYEGLQGAALEAEIRRGVTWERPSWKFATGQASEDLFDDTLGLFNFENREKERRQSKMAPGEMKAWKVMQMEPVADLEAVKKKYKQLAKENHPDRNGGDAGAEERLKDINLAYDLIKKSLSGDEDRPTSS